MCGIVGVLSWKTPPDARLVAAMTETLVHRGPDAGGVKDLGPAILGHRRLSIIDLDRRANQPMQDPGTGNWIVFNGEIYNFMAIRRDLESEGFRFTTESDTEVILAAYARWGVGCLDRFNGMFAFALWDRRNEALFLARDRAGKKPLFFFRLKQGGLAFASELKALRLHPEAPTEIDPKAISDFLSFNYVPTDRCILKGIEKLPAAHYVVVTGDTPDFRPIEYWDLAERFHQKRAYRSEAEAAGELDALVTDAVRLRLVSDVPLGAFLSGGIDSSAVVGAMSRIGGAAQTRTFSIGFREDTFNELPEAAKVARFLGVSHQDQIVDVNMANALPDIVRAADEPFADTSVVPFYYLAQFARRHVTVCLSGDGGDELFAGYDTYVADRLHRWTSFAPSWMSRVIARLCDHLLPVSFDKVGVGEKVRRFLNGHAYDYPYAHAGWRGIHDRSEQRRLLRPEWHQDRYDSLRQVERHFGRVDGCHYLDQAMYVDIKTFLADDILVKVDRATMAHSMEARTPLLDYRIMEFAAALPVDMKLKGFRKKHLFKLSQRTYLPRETVDRRKSGFNAPVSHWLAGDLAELARGAMHTAKMAEWFDLSEINRLWRDHREGRRDNGLKLFGLAMLGLWMEG